MRRSRVAVGTWVSAVILVAGVSASRASDEACTYLGLVADESAVVPLRELLINPKAFDDAFVTTEGKIQVYAGGRTLCIEMDRECIGLDFDDASLGASEDAVVKLTSQWYGQQVRINGRFAAGSPEGTGFEGELQDVSGIRLLDQPRDRTVCLGDLDEMPTPASPHEFFGEISWDEVRCGARDRDSEGRLICLDTAEPWVWTETTAGFRRSVHDRGPRDIGQIIAMGNGRFLGILATSDMEWTRSVNDKHIETGERPALVTLTLWTGERFVDVSDAVLEVAVELEEGGSREWVFFAEAKGCGGEVEECGSRIVGVNAEGLTRELWSSDSEEVIELAGLEGELQATTWDGVSKRRLRLPTS